MLSPPHAHTHTHLTSFGVFNEAILWRADKPNQQVLLGGVLIGYDNVIGRQLHSTALLDLNSRTLK